MPLKTNELDTKFISKFLEIGKYTEIRPMLISIIYDYSKQATNIDKLHGMQEIISFFDETAKGRKDKT